MAEAERRAKASRPLLLGLAALGLGVLALVAVLAVFGAPAAPPPAPPVPGVIGVEDRRPLPQFADAAGLDPRGFDASLDLVCGGQMASAALVGADLILFSAHQILHPDGRLNFGPDQPCAVVLSARQTPTRQEQIIPIRIETLETGAFKLEEGRETSFAADVTAADWALVRLSKAARGIAPYTLAPPGPLPRNTPLINVAAAQDNYAGLAVTGAADKRLADSGLADDDAADVSLGVMLAQRCQLLAQTDTLLRVDCDIGRGASGSALLMLDDAGQPLLVGMVTDSLRNPAGCAVPGGDTCFAAGPSLTADLRARILQRVTAP